MADPWDTRNTRWETRCTRRQAGGTGTSCVDSKQEPSCCGSGRHREGPSAGYCGHGVARSRCVDGSVDRRCGSSHPGPAGGSRQAGYSRAQRTRGAHSASSQGVELRPETRDLTFLSPGWQSSGAPSAHGLWNRQVARPKQIGGIVLAVWKKLPDGNWKGFRAMGV